MKTLKMLWDMAWLLATVGLVGLLLFTALTEDNPETRMLYLIGTFVVLIHHEVTKEKK